MKFGMNLLLWTGEMNDDMNPVIEMLARQGWDGVEVPIFNADLDYGMWRKRLHDNGLLSTAVTICGEDTNPASPDQAIRAAGVDALKKRVDCCHDLGATHLVGPVHSALGLFSGQGPTEDEIKWSQDSLRQVAEHAAEASVILGVEALNRFENYLLTSMATLNMFVTVVDHPNCRAMYDTFHSNIEEKSIRQAIRAIADHLCHVHISENDRSTPGRGNVRWKDNFDELKEIAYDGWMTVEAFGLALPELVAATKIWRRMYDTEEQLAKDALAFMKAEVAKRWS